MAETNPTEGVEVSQTATVDEPTEKNEEEETGKQKE